MRTLWIRFQGVRAFPGIANASTVNRGPSGERDFLIVRTLRVRVTVENTVEHTTDGFHPLGLSGWSACSVSDRRGRCGFVSRECEGFGFRHLPRFDRFETAQNVRLRVKKCGD